MGSTQSLPTELIEYILWLGCAIDLHEWQTWRHPQHNRCFIHPFASSVASVCSLWNEMTKEISHAYAAFIRLDFYTGRDDEHSIILSMAKFRHSLLRSSGSNLFIQFNWRSDDIIVEAPNDTISRIFIHAMHSILDFESQLCFIDGTLHSRGTLAYFILLLSHLKDTSWRLDFHDAHWPTFTAKFPTTVALYYSIDDIVNTLQIEEGVDGRSSVYGGHFNGSIVEAVTTLEFGERDDISIERIRRFLSDCHQVRHLSFDSVHFLLDDNTTDSGLYPSALTFSNSSVKSVDFWYTDQTEINALLSQLQLPKLSTVVLQHVQYSKSNERIRLPATVTTVRYIATHTHRSHPENLFIFICVPASSAEMIVHDRFCYFRFEMVSQINDSCHRWETQVQCWGSDALDVLHCYEEEYLGSLKQFPDEEWLKRIEEFKTTAKKFANR